MDWNEKHGGNVPLPLIISTITNAALARIPVAEREAEKVDRVMIMKTAEDGVAAMTRVGIFFTTTPPLGQSQIELRNLAVQAEVANFINRLEANQEHQLTRVQAVSLMRTAAQESSRALDALADAGIFLGRML